MSYTRTYSSTIPVNRTRTVSYPASEHGGTMTVSFSENVPVQLNVTVMTEPFDKSINEARGCTDGLTASVAAMNAANCLAIAQCSDQVSNSIIDGFYNLIQNDISTKQVEIKNQIEAKAALMKGHLDAIEDKHARMYHDIERERAKFGMVFSELDKELERRITEVDKPVFKLSKKARDEVVITPHLTLAAATAEQLGAGSNTDGNIAVAGLRQKVSAVLQNLFSFLNNNLIYRHTMRDILWNKSVGETQQQDYIPVAYSVAEDISSANLVCKCYVSDNKNKESILTSVRTFVSKNYNSSASAIPEDEMKLIEQAFTSMVQDDYSSNGEHDEYRERVYTEILRLWNSGNSSLKQV